ncbi:GNAT family N-acetyltransferase [Kiloniella laminariae]|uniref:GNAT family N-acetyltransferase n=1 Tax=Kiloniella laminariae TaxID=454162 RepID=A0ABT4LH53_9PROT|nr:GNAT family N-acetyltransferase [Kiloniella laminariae]MCZ4280435.1 GNAT family N-acetyltransferase [Kiloniella laminariae]
MSLSQPRIQCRVLRPAELPDCQERLAEILHACVTSGASVSFIEPFSLTDSRTFWQDKVFPAVCRGGRILIVVEIDQVIAGTVQLDIDLPPNQPHRCEVSKLLVHPDYRKRGLAKALMTTLEDQARTLDKKLITLDTKSGDKAEPLYHSLGYCTAGSIPGFALDTTGNSLHATTYMYKRL